MPILLSKFLTSKAITAGLLLLLGGGGWFIYSELQDKAVIEDELTKLKASRAVVESADKGLVQAVTVVKRKSVQIKAEVQHAINADDGDLTDESIRSILCGNGMAHSSACTNPQPLPH